MKSPARDLLLVLLGALLVGAGLLVGLLIFSGEGTPDAAVSAPTTGPASTVTEPTVTAATTTPPPSSTSQPPISTTTTTTTAPTTTTTVPADQDGPIVNFLQSTESDLWENANYGGCPAQTHTAAVTAVVFDPSGLDVVELGWSVNSLSWTVAMTEVAPDIYSTDIGPFHEDTLASGGGVEPFYILVFASDTLGNVTTVETTTLITLHDCAI